MANNLRKREQKKVYFIEEELEKIVSYIPNEGEVRQGQFVDDENVSHRGTEIYDRLGVVSEMFEYDFDIEEMMSRYALEISREIVFHLVLRRIIGHLLNVAFGTLSTENMFQ